jgi:hypothetical protein
MCEPEGNTPEGRLYVVRERTTVLINMTANRSGLAFRPVARELRDKNS